MFINDYITVKATCYAVNLLKIILSWVGIGVTRGGQGVLKLEISLSFDKIYFARKSLSFRNIFAILISSQLEMLKR